MKVSKIREMDDQVLTGEIAKAENELMHLRMKASIGSLDNPMEIRHLRRAIARMHTVLGERRKQNN
ncbi:MAG: 50S ribosomal protein L29 [Acidobacteria bacterium]|nr:50S ribosomal protein L29 [Acidobacteriota bacterium]MCB9399628.1 50S ribosomal protein L29 [Acidobacteriota bacterium]